MVGGRTTAVLWGVASRTSAATQIAESLMGHTSVIYVGRGTDLVGCVSSGTFFPSSLKEPFVQASTLFVGVRVIAWRLRHPSLGECRRSLRYFLKCWAYVGSDPASEPTLKRPCAAFAGSDGCAINIVASRTCSI